MGAGSQKEHGINLKQNKRPQGTLNFMPETFGDSHGRSPNFAIKNHEKYNVGNL